MDIVSLGIAGTSPPEKRDSLHAEIIQHLQILIRGMALHAIESDEGDMRDLQQRMSAIADSLSQGSSPEDFLVCVGKTLRALEEYNHKAAIVFKGQVEELRGMLAAMTSTVKVITASSETSVKQLSAIETKLQRASTLEDTRQVKAFMADCLTMVRSESKRLQAESSSKIDSLKGNVERLSGLLKAASLEDSQDQVTGLPGRFAAEKDIAGKISDGKDFVVSLFLLNRMASINGRFGRLVGDEILVSGARLIAQKLSGTTLYRWSGPAFAAIFDPSVTAVVAETRSKQAAGLRLEKNIDADDRSVLIVVTASCHVQRVSAAIAPETVCKAMDAFIGAQGAAAG